MGRKGNKIKDFCEAEPRRGQDEHRAGPSPASALEQGRPPPFCVGMVGGAHGRAVRWHSLFGGPTVYLQPLITWGETLITLFFFSLAFTWSINTLPSERDVAQMLARQIFGALRR